MCPSGVGPRHSGVKAELSIPVTMPPSDPWAKSIEPCPYVVVYNMRSWEVRV